MAACVYWHTDNSKQNLREQKILYKYDKLNRDEVYVKKAKVVVQKLIFINKINLPKEIVGLIKDCVFFTWDYVIHFYLTKMICRDVIQMTIHRTIWTGENDDVDYDHEIEFEFENKNTNSGFYIQTSVCGKCGNYTVDLYYEDFENPHILCQCDNHPFYQIQNNEQEFLKKSSMVLHERYAPPNGRYTFGVNWERIDIAKIQKDNLEFYKYFNRYLVWP